MKHITVEDVEIVEAHVLKPFNELSEVTHQHNEKALARILGKAFEQFNEGAAMMPIKVMEIDGVTDRACDAKDLHKALDVKGDFTAWVKYQIERNGFELGVDYLLMNFHEQVPHQGGFRTVTTTKYILSETATDMIAMQARSPEGQAIRKYISKCKQLTMRLVAYELGNATLYALTGPAAQRNKYLADQDAEKAAKKQVAEDYKQFLKDFVGPPTREQAELPFSLLKLENAELTANLEKCHTYMRHVGKCVRDINKGNGQMPKPVYKISDFYENFDTYIEKL